MQLVVPIGTPIGLPVVPMWACSPPCHRGEGSNPGIPYLPPHTVFPTFVPKPRQMNGGEKPNEHELKRKARARRRDRNALFDFANRAISHADKYDMPALMITVHPEDDTEQKCIIMNTASDAFLFEAVMAIVTSNQAVGMKVIATLMRNSKENGPVPAPAFAPGDMVVLLPPDDTMEDGPFKARMTALAGSKASVFASNEEHTIVELHDGERLRYDVKFLSKQADGEGATDGGGQADGSEEAGNAQEVIAGESAGPDEAVREVLQDAVQEPLGDGEVRADAGPSPDGEQLQAH